MFDHHRRPPRDEDRDALDRVRLIQLLTLGVFLLPLFILFGCVAAPAGGDSGTSLGTAPVERSHPDGLVQAPVISRQSDVPDGPRREPRIRVRIEERRGHSRVVVVCRTASVLESDVRRGRVPVECVVEAADGNRGIMVNGTQLPTNRVTFRSGDPDSGETFQLVAGDADPLPLRGALTLQRTAAGTLDPIITIGMEDWVRGAVLAEMPASFGAEALRAQAIAIRTYGLYKLLSDEQRVDSSREGDDQPATRTDRGYDVASSVADLRYGGIPYESAAGNQATDSTRGRVLTYRGRVFVAYFHSTSGGATIPAWQYFGNFRDFPPLQGVVAPFDDSSPVNEWQLTHKWADWREKLIAAGVPEATLGERLTSAARIYHPGIDRVPDPLVPDPARRPLAFELGTEKGFVTIKAVELRRIIGGSRTGMPSTACVIIPHGDTLTLAGRGWGHGVGMCQFGARGLAEDGASYHEILGHYYPGSRITSWYR